MFATRNGTALDADNLRARTIKPLMQEAGAPWAAFHALRHTYASLQLAGGANVVQLSRALGHHSAAFTLDVYADLLDGEEAPALDLAAVLPAPPPSAPIRLLPVAERDALLRDHIETVDYIGPVTGEPYRPDPLPVVYDPEGDADSE